jgi:hypothetical protein
MADDAQDIFGKIDAMLGKRAGFGGAPPRVDDEFPLLTEVVAEVEAPAQDMSGNATDAMSNPAEAAEPDAGETRAPALADMDIDRLAAALEARLSELFIRQQLRIEAIVRRVVREELDARRD